MFSPEGLTFFTILFSTNPWFLRNDLVTSTVLVKIPEVCNIRYIEKKIGQIILFAVKIAVLFKKWFFEQPVRCYRNDLITSTVGVKIVFGLLDLHNLFPEVCRTRFCKKIWSIFFFTGKFAFSFRSLCFQHSPRSWRNDLTIFTIIVKVLCGPL